MMSAEMFSAMQAAARCRQYGYWAKAFHNPSFCLDGQTLDLPLPPAAPDHAAAFLDAFDPAVSETACSLWEGAYVAQDRSGLFEELARFYDHFGLARAASAELPDHIAVELEFMHFLTHLEHEMHRRGGIDGGLRLAQRDFLSRHLLRLASGMQSSCRSGDPRINAMTNGLHAFVTADYEHICGSPANEPAASS